MLRPADSHRPHHGGEEGYPRQIAPSLSALVRTVRSDRPFDSATNLSSSPKDITCVNLKRTHLTYLTLASLPVRAPPQPPQHRQLTRADGPSPHSVRAKDRLTSEPITPEGLAIRGRKEPFGRIRGCWPGLLSGSHHSMIDPTTSGNVTSSLDNASCGVEEFGEEGTCPFTLTLDLNAYWLPHKYCRHRHST